MLLFTLLQIWRRWCFHLYSDQIWRKLEACNSSVQFFWKFATYSCRMFEYFDIICRHILTVFGVRGISALPSQCFVNRWTKNAMDRSSSKKVDEVNRVEEQRSSCWRWWALPNMTLQKVWAVKHCMLKRYWTGSTISSDANCSPTTRRFWKISGG